MRALGARHPPSELSAWGGELPASALGAGEDLAPSGVRTIFGGDGVELLDADPQPRCLVKSPGIPFDHPLIAAALARGMTVIDEAELGWRLDGRPMVAVTGTNGKSTVVALVAAVLRAAGRQVLVGGNTQFDPPLSALADEEGDVVVGEISSFQLEGSPTLLPEVGVLTNLAPHHLIRHGDVARYAELKRRLFARGERTVGLAVLNLDDPLGCRLAGDVRARGGEVASYGESSDADYRVVGCEWTLRSARARIATPAGEVELDTPHPGAHGALNGAAALALAAGVGVRLDEAARVIGKTPAPPGRLEVVHEGPPCDVVVDGALSPQAIRAVLTTVREARGRDPSGRVIAVAAGIDIVNDVAEQRAMGSAARELSDLLILTSQRWRSGVPRKPLQGLVDGARGAQGGDCEVVGDRRAAIDRALACARPGDVVVVLGRGARRGPLLDENDQPRSFDDRDEVRAALGTRRFGRE